MEKVYSKSIALISFLCKRPNTLHAHDVGAIFLVYSKNCELLLI